MNLKRFTARTSREAMALVKAAFGEDAVVMSTKPCAEGVEILAMAPESVNQIERVGATAEAAPRQTQNLARPRATAPAAPAVQRQPAPRVEPSLDHGDVADDVEQLQMSTLSFQDYVRQRMLKRRDAERHAEAAAAAALEPEVPAPLPPSVAPIEAARARHAQRREPAAAAPRADIPVLRDEVRLTEPTPVLAAAPSLPSRGEQIEMMSELRSMRGLIEQRFGALAFMEKLQRHPRAGRA